MKAEYERQQRAKSEYDAKINVMMSLLAMVMEKVSTLLRVPTRKEIGCLMLLMRQKSI